MGTAGPGPGSAPPPALLQGGGSSLLPPPPSFFEGDEDLREMPFSLLASPVLAPRAGASIC